MANKFDLKQNIRDSVTKETNLSDKQETVLETSLSDDIILKKKTDDKKNKKSFNVYMEPDLVKILDGICKKSGYSRNELINFYCNYGASKTKIE